MNKSQNNCRMKDIKKSLVYNSTGILSLGLPSHCLQSPPPPTSGPKIRVGSCGQGYKQLLREWEGAGGAASGSQAGIWAADTVTVKWKHVYCREISGYLGRFSTEKHHREEYIRARGNFGWDGYVHYLHFADISQGVEICQKTFNCVLETQ